MKTVLISSLAAVLLFSSASLRSPSMTEVLSLSMPDGDGTNSAGLAWHPVNKKYYVAFAGNERFPMAVFDEYGKRVTRKEMTALQDVRGLWYNTSTRSLEGNGAGDRGYFRYLLDGNGLPSGISVIHTKTAQPDFQSAGTFDPKKKQVICFNGQALYGYHAKTGALKFTTNLNLQGSSSDYNSTSVIVVPSRKGQAGILNVRTKTVEFYHMKKGQFTGSLQLPDSAPVADWFGFAWANGYYWIFDVDNRTWRGYR